MANRSENVLPHSENDFLRFIRSVHSGECSDPQEAIIDSGSRNVRYITRYRGVLGCNYNLSRIVYESFVDGLKFAAPKECDVRVSDNSQVKLNINLETTVKELDATLLKARDEGKYSPNMEVEISYTAKDEKEFGELRKFFENIPTDFGMPEKGQNHFVYD